MINVTPTTPPPSLNYQAHSAFDDVWTRADTADICAFCAYELPSDLPNHCPQCQRKLYVSTFEYKKASTNVTLYWVLVISLSQLFLVQTIVDVVNELPVPQMVLHFLLVPTYFVLGVLVAWRQQVAFYVSLVVLAITGLLLAALPFVYEPLANVLGAEVAQTPIFGLTMGVSFALLGALRVLQATAVVIALFVGLFLIMPDFNRQKIWLLARLDRKLPQAPDLHLAANRWVEKGMWATAVLHWRKAVLLDPYRLLYHLHLAQAYAHLKFYQRSLDVLQSASQIVQSDEARRKIKQMRLTIQAQAKQDT